MKVRKMLAALLCVAIVFSSESFSLKSYAQEQSNSQETEQRDENQEKMSGQTSPTAAPEETGTPETSTEPSEEPQGQPTAEPSQTPEEMPDGAEPTMQPTASNTPQETGEPVMTPSGEAVPTETPKDLSDGSPSPSVTPTSFPTGTPTGTPEGTPLVSPTPTDGLSDLLSPSPAVSATPTVSPTPTAGIALMNSQIMLASSSALFEVEADGKLKLKEGSSLGSGVILIPDEAKIIPKGIFQGNSKYGYVIKFGDDSQLTTIEAGAFQDSYVTEIVNLPAGVTAFAEETFKDSSLRKITYKENNIQSVGEEAFMGTGLTSFEASDQLTSIGERAFADCGSLSSLKLGNVQTIGSRAFANCGKLNDGSIGWSRQITSIGSYAFSGCGFTSLDLSLISGEITIGAGAFQNCADMISVRLPGNMTVVSQRIFENCRRLTEVMLPGACTTIETSAFGNCSSLQKIDIPEKISLIEDGAFSGCGALTDITIRRAEEEELTIVEGAFPDKSGVTMRGYDGAALDYAEKKGYSFVTLYPECKLILSEGAAKYATLSISSRGARLDGKNLWVRVGQEVEATLTVKKDYTSQYALTAESFKVIGKETVKGELISSSQGKQVFSFVMPEADRNTDNIVKVDAVFMKIADATKGTLDWRLEKVDNQPVTGVDKANKKVTMKQTGERAQLVVSGNTDMGSWLLNFKSSNTNVAAISDTGLISAKGKGQTTISATLKNDAKKSISFTLVVEEDAFIQKLDLEFSGLDRAKKKTEEIDGVSYPVIEYNKAMLSQGSQSFKVTLKAYDSGAKTNNLVINSEWSAVDSGIAGPANAKSSNNANTVNVKKGAEGETFITVTVTNKDKEKTQVSESFIVRVVDATPRLADAKVAVNQLSTAGTAIDLVEVYGYEINQNVPLTLCEKKLAGSIVDYEISNDLEIYRSEGTYYIRAYDSLSLAAGKSKTYKGNSQLYIKGEFESGGTFIIPVPEITVTNKALNPAIKLTGKINLFYNSSATPQEQGSVQLTQNLTNEEVEKYELVSTENYKSEGSEAPDSFANNFQISETGLITRTANEMMKVNGKDVVKGYVYIWYKGYNTPVKKSITIATCNTSPVYVLSLTTATANVRKTNQEYDLKLLDKKTKEEIPLENLEELTFDESGSGTTYGLFQDLDMESAKSSHAIPLKVKGTPQNGKAVINVKMSSWSKYLKYTFTLKTTQAMPTVKLSATTVTLNSLSTRGEAKITASTNQEDAQMAGFETPVFSGGVKQREEAEKIQFTTEDDTITVKLNGTVAQGAYRFTITPKVKFDEEELPVKNLTLTVNVNSTQPAVTLKSGTLGLNLNYAGKEKVATTLTVSGLPTGSTFTLDPSEVVLTPTAKAGTSQYVLAEKIAKNITLTFGEPGEKNACEVTAQLAEGSYANFNYAYTVNGLKVNVNGDLIAVKPFRLTVKGTRTNPSVTVTAKGTLNPVDSASKIDYTITVKNVVSSIDQIEIWELKPDGSFYMVEGKKGSEHFELSRADEAGNVVSVKAKDGVKLDGKKTYKIMLAYKLAVVEGDDYRPTGELRITPRQTLPKISANVKSAYLYAGQNRAKTVLITLDKTTLKEGAEIETVMFDKKTPALIKKAFKVEYLKESSQVKLTLVNPAILVLNKKQTITFETVCKNQMDNTTGTTFKVDITVKK